MREMKLIQKSTDRAPLMLAGILCWLCGAVLIGVLVQALAGWTLAAIAVIVTSALVLAIAWKLGGSMESIEKTRREGGP